MSAFTRFVSRGNIVEAAHMEALVTYMRSEVSSGEVKSGADEDARPVSSKSSAYRASR
ncbi:MAG: hypothetical protein ACLSVD_04935 [Eggerthellaceae bacterium]